VFRIPEEMNWQTRGGIAQDMGGDDKGEKWRNVIVVTISSSILIKNLRLICDEEIFVITISDNNIIIYYVLLFLYMVEVRGSTPLSPTKPLKACEEIPCRLYCYPGKS